MSSVPRPAEITTAAPGQLRWLALSIIALAQLMVALDATIVSIALPWAQRALGAPDTERQWVITAYTLAFGGLLLTGGRIADTLGRKRTFLIGLAGFALASAIGGSAGSFAILLIARAAQGAFAALLAPTALSLLATTFIEPRERAKAFALYGAIAGSGAAIGLLLGGVLTQYLSWRWCLYVNVGIATFAALGASRLLGNDPGTAARRFDIPGVILATGALTSLVYACSRAVTDGWRSATVFAFLATSLELGSAFVLREARTSAPLLPLRIVLDRNRGGANLAVGLTVSAMFGACLFLTYYLQSDWRRWRLCRSCLAGRDPHRLGRFLRHVTSVQRRHVRREPTRGRGRRRERERGEPGRRLGWDRAAQHYGDWRDSGLPAGEPAVCRTRAAGAGPRIFKRHAVGGRHPHGRRSGQRPADHRRTTGPALAGIPISIWLAPTRTPQTLASH